MHKLGGILSVTALGLLTGGMLLFPIMTLLIFTRLPLDVAGPFVRGCFPVYYAFMVGLSAFACLGFVLRSMAKTAIIPGAVTLISLWAWVWLIPHLNTDLQTGNHAAFAHGHTLSVWIDAIEFIVLLGLLSREGLRSARRFIAQ